VLNRDGARGNIGGTLAWGVSDRRGWSARMNARRWAGVAAAQAAEMVWGPGRATLGSAGSGAPARCVLGAYCMRFGLRAET